MDEFEQLRHDVADLHKKLKTVEVDERLLEGENIALRAENALLRDLIEKLISAIPRAHLPLPVGPSNPPANPLDGFIISHHEPASPRPPPGSGG